MYGLFIIELRPYTWVNSYLLKFLSKFVQSWIACSVLRLYNWETGRDGSKTRPEVKCHREGILHMLKPLSQWHHAFSSLEPAILLVCAKDRSLVQTRRIAAFGDKNVALQKRGSAGLDVLNKTWPIRTHGDVHMSRNAVWKIRHCPSKRK